MPAPVLLLVGPLIVALIVALLSRWSVVATLVGVLGLLILSLLVAGADPEQIAGTDRGGLFFDDTLIVYGRALVLTEVVQWTFLTAYAAMGLLFLLSLLVPQGNLFVTLSLVVLSPMAAALMLQPFVFGAVLMLIATGILAAFIQGGRAGSTLAAVRFLAFLALAASLFLLAGWMLESDQITYSSTIARLFGVAFLILLAGFPFQIWVAPVFRESRTLVPVVLFGLIQLMYLVFCLNLLTDFPAVQRNSQFLQLIRSGAVLTLALASILALAAPSFGRLVAYLLLLDAGATVLSLSFGGQLGLEVTLSLAIARLAGLIMTGFGLQLIRRQLDPELAGEDPLSAGRGLAWRTPLGVALFLFGCLSLVGLPLTPGFSGRWATVILAGAQSQSLAAVLVVAVAAGSVAVLRNLYPVLIADTGERRRLVPENRELRAVALLLLLIAILLALVPQTVLSFGQHMAELF